VWLASSEDAKAVGEYISAHIDQTPAPFVVLARHLPMAVLYDPQTLDLSDASVADRLRKQVTSPRFYYIYIYIYIYMCIYKG